MANKYLNFVSDEHLLNCISNLHKSYMAAKANVTKSKLYRNKVDIFKLTFDSKFNELSEDQVVKNEILRQIDKSINNSIGTFHEEVLGGVTGYERGNQSGYDIKASDDTLFADIKNKHNTMNSSSAESLFQKLACFADSNKEAECYWVQILAKKSFCEKWFGDINGKEYSHSRVYKISGDQFYSKLTGEHDSFFKLYRVLPRAIEDFLNQSDIPREQEENTALGEIKDKITANDRSIFEQITFENYSYYPGFKSL